MMEKMTIIVPVYNTEKYLKECIESILNQTYKNFELILVDDGSADNSGKICDAYENQDNRIKVIHKQNGGLSSARNKGIDISKTNYLSFIDSDDILPKNYFSVMLDAMISNNADIVTSDMKRFQKADELEQYLEFIPNNYCVNNNNAMKLLVNYSEINFSACSKIFNKKLFKDIQFNEKRIFEDMDIMYRLIASSNKTVIIKNLFYYYRITPNSILNAKYSPKRLVEYDIRKEMYNFYCNNYPEYAPNVYAHFMFNSIFMYVRIIKTDDINISKYKYLLEFDKNILKKINMKELPKNIKLGVHLYKISPLLLAFALKLKYKNL